MRNRLRRLALAALAALVAGCGGGNESAKSQSAAPAPAAAAAAAAAQGLPDDALRLRLVQIMDRSGFEKPMVAASILIPPDWRAQGGVVWDEAHLCAGGYSFDWKALSPNGMQGVAIFPGDSWTANNFGAPPPPGCRAANLRSARAYLEGLARRARPGAAILDYRPREDIADDFSGVNAMTATAMGEIETWVEVGELLIGYVENGREMRETLLAPVIFSRSRMKNPVSGQIMETLNAQALPGFATHAPDGALDFRLSEAVRLSFRLAPQWEERINAHNAASVSIQAQGAAARSRIISESGEEIARMQRQSWENQQASQARQARAFSETLRGVQRYADPARSSGSVELPGQFENAWRLDDGSYVLTNDPAFDPYAATGQAGVKLKPQD